MEQMDTTFENWQIQFDVNLKNLGVGLVWLITARYERACLVVHLLADDLPWLAEVILFTGGQMELTTQIPLRVYADPRASLLSLELASLFVVRDAMVNVEPG